MRELLPGLALRSRVARDNASAAGIMAVVLIVNPRMNQVRGLGRRNDRE
jgi:hypothetical protein